MNQVKTGRFIAEMRKQQNLTQREFADILGISDKTVSKWECGDCPAGLGQFFPLRRQIASAWKSFREKSS